MHRLCCLFLATALLGLAGCHVLNHLTPLPHQQPVQEADSPPTLPGKSQYRLPPYLFLADFEIDRSLPLFRELANLRDQVTRELNLPASTKGVTVYLFSDRGRYERYIKHKHPELPPRRAFFVAQPWAVGGGEDLLVYTYWGDKIQQDLRHELTHALLHSVLKDVPLWLDEGLAEYFENPPGWSGINFQHLELLKRDGMTAQNFNLARLEQLKEIREMTPAEYREAWAWVHLMLRGDPRLRRALISYLHELQHTNRPGPLQPRLAAILPNLNTALERHLAELDSTRPRTGVPARAKR